MPNTQTAKKLAEQSPRDRNISNLIYNKESGAKKLPYKAHNPLIHKSDKGLVKGYRAEEGRHGRNTKGQSSRSPRTGSRISSIGNRSSSYVKFGQNPYDEIIDTSYSPDKDSRTERVRSGREGSNRVGNQKKDNNLPPLNGKANQSVMSGSSSQIPTNYNKSLSRKNTKRLNKSVDIKGTYSSREDTVNCARGQSDYKDNKGNGGYYDDY